MEGPGLCGYAGTKGDTTKSLSGIQRRAHCGGSESELKRLTPDPSPAPSSPFPSPSPPLP